MPGDRRYVCGMDGSRRVALPAAIRRELVKEKKAYVILSRGGAGSVILYLPGQFDAALERLKKSIQGPDTTFRRRACLRAFVAASLRVFPDSRGRVTVHSSLLPDAPRVRRVALRWPGSSGG